MAILAAGLIAAPLQAKNYPPLDKCSHVVGATQFQAALSTAVESRDEEALINLFAEDVKLDFGGGAGHQELRKRLTDKDFMLWRELAAIIKLGCAADDGSTLTMPRYFAEDMGEIDPFEGHLVTGYRVAMREGPDLEAKVIERLSWVPVLVGYEARRPGDFVAVRKADGTAGFIHREYLRSLVDYRIIAVKIDGKWKVTAFVAGD